MDKGHPLDGNKKDDQVQYPGKRLLQWHQVTILAKTKILMQSYFIFFKCLQWLITAFEAGMCRHECHITNVLCNGVH